MGMKRLSISVFLLLTVLASLMVGCSKQAGTTTISPTNTASSTSKMTWDELKLGIANGRAIAEEIISLIPENKVWLSLIPPVGGEKVHLLTEGEKDRILQIARAFYPVFDAQGHKNVLSVDERDYFWKSYNHEEAVNVSNVYMEKRGISQKLDEYMGDKCYPGVFLLFHTQYDKYAYAGMNIVVNLEQERVIYVEGFIEAIDWLPEYESSSVSPESFTLDHGNNLVSPLNPNYNPSMIFGPEGTRFGPPWDNSTTPVE